MASSPLPFPFPPTTTSYRAGAIFKFEMCQSAPRHPVLEKMSEDKNFTGVCSVQSPPSLWTVWSTFRVHTNKWTWSHPQPLLHAHISEDTKHSSAIRSNIPSRWTCLKVYSGYKHCVVQTTMTPLGVVQLLQTNTHQQTSHSKHRLTQAFSDMARKGSILK